MSSRTQKRKFEDEAWETHKTAILDLYVTQGKPLKHVASVLANRGFVRTKPQYERVFKQWSVTKNISASEWKYIFRRLHERQAEGKLSEVRVRGMMIPHSKLEKEKPRYSFQTTLERYALKTDVSSTLEAPPGVEVCTPGLVDEFQPQNSLNPCPEPAVSPSQSFVKTPQPPRSPSSSENAHSLRMPSVPEEEPAFVNREAIQPTSIYSITPSDRMLVEGNVQQMPSMAEEFDLAAVMEPFDLQMCMWEILNDFNSELDVAQELPRPSKRSRCDIIGRTHTNSGPPQQQLTQIGERYFVWR